jgi:hypothetical protein
MNLGPHEHEARELITASLERYVFHSSQGCGNTALLSQQQAV